MKIHTIAICLVLGSSLLTSCSMSAASSSSFRAEAFYPDPAQVEFVEAAARGNIKRVDVFLNANMDINVRGKEGMTPLLLTLLRQNKVGYQHLLECGANPNLLVDTGESVMMYATRAEDPQWLRLALEHGGNPNLVGLRNMKPPLHDSIIFERIENMRLLIAKGADINLQDGTGGTALLTAASHNAYNVVYELLERGADYHIRDLSNATIVNYIATGPMDPRNELTRWRGKVIAWLAERGIKAEPPPPIRKQ